MLDKLAKYKILGKIGQGGMGEVYKAEDPQLKRIVALKVVARDRQADANAQSRFLREARAASSLNHPNIVTVYDFGQTRNIAFIVMEYVEGENLRSLMIKGPVDQSTLLKIADQVCSALEEAHGHGLAHRDIKPENILLTRNGTVKLVDFGLVKQLNKSDAGSESTTADRISSTGAALGTPIYMSPEQLLGGPVDHRTDIFSLGIVLHEMFFGRVPFSGANVLEIAAAILRDPASLMAPAPNTFAAGLVKVLEHALEKNRDKRFASVSEFRKALEILGRKYATKGGSAPDVPEAPETPPPAKDIRSILVLPLEPVGRSEEEAFLGVGLAHSIITDLARFPGLTVLSKAAGSQAHTERMNALALAKELGAGILLEGEVMRMGARFGVNARLTEVQTGRVLWGSQYRGNSEDLFNIQDEVCKSVAEAMQLKVSTGAQHQISDAKTDNLPAFELLAKGKALLERRDIRQNITESIRLFEQALQLDPKFALAYAQLGEACWREYQETHDSVWVDRAVSACDHALILDPGQPQVHISLAIIYFGTGRTERAIEELERALQLQPNSDEAYKWLGRCYRRKGDVQKAVSNYENAIRIRPGYWDHYIQLGACLVEFGRYEEAVEQFRLAISVAPDNHVGYTDLGVTYYLLGRFEDAADFLKRAIEIHPNQSTLSNLGSSYFCLQKYEDAIEAFESAVQMDPRNDICHRNLGDAYLQSGRHTNAREQYGIARDLLLEALNINPSEAALLARLAVVQAKLGAKDEAVANINKAITIEPTDTRIMHAQAVVWALSDEPARAIESLRLALRHKYSRSDIERDPDLMKLRSHPDYDTLLYSADL